MISGRRLLLQLPRPQQYPSASEPGDPTTAAIVTASPYVQPATAIAILVFFIAIFLLGFLSVLLRFFNRVVLSESGTSADASPIPDCRKGGGLDPAALKSLPLVPYSGDGECVVCLSEFEEKETVKLIPYCGHVFHPTCLDMWLKCHVTCPFCRSAQLFSLGGGACPGAARGQIGFGAPRESTVVPIEPLVTWGPDGVRRVSSCSDLEQRTPILKRSSSF